MFLGLLKLDQKSITDILDLVGDLFVANIGDALLQMLGTLFNSPRDLALPKAKIISKQLARSLFRAGCRWLDGRG